MQRTCKYHDTIWRMKEKKKKKKKDEMKEIIFAHFINFFSFFGMCNFKLELAKC